MYSQLTKRDPAEAYRRVAMDAAAIGSDSRGLSLLCFDELLQALGRALSASRPDQRLVRSAALNRAIAALSGLRLGLDMENPVAKSFDTLFVAADASLRTSLVRFEAGILQNIRADFQEIRSAIAGEDALIFASVDLPIKRSKPPFR